MNPFCEPCSFRLRIVRASEGVAVPEVADIEAGRVQRLLLELEESGERHSATIEKKISRGYIVRATAHRSKYTREYSGIISDTFEAPRSQVSVQLINENVVDYEVVPHVRDTSHVLKEMQHMAEREEMQSHIVLTAVPLGVRDSPVQVPLGIGQREEVLRELTRRETPTVGRVESAGDGRSPA